MNYEERLTAIIRAQGALISLYQEWVAKTAGALVSVGAVLSGTELAKQIHEKRREIEKLKEGK